MTRLYGMFADLSNKAVLVVGGGIVAERKVAALLKVGADITVGAPELTPTLAGWKTAGRLQHLEGNFAEHWLDHCWLVVAATDQPFINKTTAAAANARHRFVNVVDNAELSSFQVPAIVDRGVLQIAISTAGAAPALGRKIRGDIEAQLDDSISALIALVGKCRQRIKTRFPGMRERRRFYEQLPNSEVSSYLKAQNADAAEAALSARLDVASTTPQGQVTLVGAGPGDPGLLSLHGLRALQTADVILHDRLVSDAVLDMARRDADVICVGKAPGAHRFTQARINTLMVEKAKAGNHVVRLKGGDPFIFGRGGEELEELHKHDIAYQVVPGITAANACSAYSGIPLTHRAHAQSVRFITAHCKASIDTLDWQSLAAERQTLAIYMGVKQLPTLREELITRGRSPATPFALVENGTRPEQRVITGKLDELVTKAAKYQVAAPALLILGEVAKSGSQLAWFGEAGIANKRAAILRKATTEATDQASPALLT